MNKMSMCFTSKKSKKSLKKSFVLISVFSSIFLLTACGGKKIEESLKATPEEMNYEVSTPDPNAITIVTNDIIVDEIDEDEVYDFPDSYLTCIMPKNFKKSSDVDGEYLSKNYPRDVSSINHVIIESDENVTNQTQEEFLENLVTDFEDAYGDKVDIKITQFDKIKVDGRPGLWIMYNYDFRGDRFYVLNVILYNGVETNYLTFLQGPKADWMEDFIASAETLAYVDK